MKLTRRDFLKAGGASAAGLGIFLTAAGKIAGQDRFESAAGASDLVGSMNPELMEKFIGRDFTFYSNEAVYQGKLIEVAVLSTKKPKRGFLGKTQPVNGFTLKFRLRSVDLPQATYRIFEPTLGQFELLLVPGAGVDGTSDLIATFSRI